MGSDCGNVSEEIFELLLAIADLCGFFPQDDVKAPEEHNDCRLQLIQSLSLLSANRRMVDRDAGNILLDDGLKSSLLEFEETAACVRRNADAFRVAIDEERSEILLLVEELEDLGVQPSGRSSLRWIVFGRSLISQYLEQSLRELEMVRDLQERLDGLYYWDETNDAGENIRRCLQMTIKCLRRDNLTAHPQFREGVFLLQQLHGGTGWKSSVPRNKPAPKELTRTIKQQVKSQCLESKTPSFHRASPWDVFEKFQGTTENGTEPDNPFVCSMLVVGSRGTGKTHLCNEMERAAGSSTTGRLEPL